MAIVVDDYKIKKWFTSGQYTLKNEAIQSGIIFLMNLKPFEYEFASHKPIFNETLNIEMQVMGSAIVSIENPMLFLKHFLSYKNDLSNLHLLEFLDLKIEAILNDYFKVYSQIEDLFFEIKKVSVHLKQLVQANVKDYGFNTTQFRISHLSLPEEVVSYYATYQSCTGCQKMIPADSKFCTFCGVSQLKICEACGDNIEHQYCPTCGFGNSNTSLE